MSSASEGSKRGGARQGAGRKKREPQAAAQTLDGRTSIAHTIAGKILDLPEELTPKLEAKLSDNEKAWHSLLWRRNEKNQLTDAAEGTRRYLLDKHEGTAVRIVRNYHYHDKPLEVNMQVSLADAISKARKRAESR